MHLTRQGRDGTRGEIRTRWFCFTGFKTVTPAGSGDEPTSRYPLILCVASSYMPACEKTIFQKLGSVVVAQSATYRRNGLCRQGHESDFLSQLGSGPLQLFDKASRVW